MEQQPYLQTFGARRQSNAASADILASEHTPRVENRMDAATLRLILIIVGVAFLIGLYLWERRRAEAREDEHDWDNYLNDKREPNLGPLESETPDLSDDGPWGDFDEESAFRPEPEPEPEPESDPELDLKPEPEPGPDLEPLLESEPEADREPKPEPVGSPDWDLDREEPKPESEPDPTAVERPMGADADADSGVNAAASASPTPASAPASSDEAPKRAGDDAMLIQLFVVAVREPFAGERILAAAKRLKLTPGSMDIFHRLASDDSARAPLYSMANLIKPGSFPLRDMRGFESPGLALFAQLGGDPSDLMVFDELLHAARALAGELGGEVQERGRHPLTDERAKALRAQVSALLQRAPGQSDTQ
jgi:cell division protein ZipA